jgi:hypothetical protein
LRVRDWERSTRVLWGGGRPFATIMRDAKAPAAFEPPVIEHDSTAELHTLIAESNA